MGGDTTLNK